MPNGSLPRGYLWIIRLAPQRTWRGFAKYHYLPHLPGPNKATYTLHLHHHTWPYYQAAGIACYTYPPISSAARNTVFGPLFKPSFTNRHTAAILAHRCITTLSRMVILPQFQPMKIATPFLQATAATFDTPIIEAHTIIGRTLKFFEKAGMTMLRPRVNRYTNRARSALRTCGLDFTRAFSLADLQHQVDALPLAKRKPLMRDLTAWHTYHCRGPTTGQHKTTPEAVLADAAMNLWQNTYYAYSARPDYLTVALRMLMVTNSPLSKKVELCPAAQS